MEMHNKLIFSHRVEINFWIIEDAFKKHAEGNKYGVIDGCSSLDDVYKVVKKSSKINKI